MWAKKSARKVSNISSIEFDFVLKADVPRIVENWRRLNYRRYIVLTNPHSVMVCHRDEEMRAATTGAGLTLPDGVGIILAAKLLGHGRRHRVTGPDLMLKVCGDGREFGLRHFFLGGSEGVAEKLAERMSEQFPGLKIAGTYCPPFRQLTAEEDETLVDRINATKPDVVWVGLGAPKQEKWMAAHLGRVKAATMIGVGAAFDFHTGNVPWAPGWVRRAGLEWAYRFITEPRRMWRRNLDSPLFLGSVLIQAMKNKLKGMLPGRATSRRRGDLFLPVFRDLGLSEAEIRELAANERAHLSMVEAR
jgi:N-acetylglucosaminyldiphosphoundecaprenol N-acetyl-beta-D-mannosaminyltransferase